MNPGDDTALAMLAGFGLYCVLAGIAALAWHLGLGSLVKRLLRVRP